MSKKTILIIVLIFLFISLSITGYLWFSREKENNPEQAYNILSIDEAYFIYRDELEAKDYQETLDKLYKTKESLEKNPQSPPNWYNFAFYKNYLGDKQGAVLAWEKAFKLNPRRYATANNLADLYNNYVKDYEKAEFYYLKSLELRTNFSGYLKLADLYRYHMPQKHEKIEPLLREAIEKMPDQEITILKYLYEFYDEIGDTEKKEEYYQKIIEIKPDFK